MQNPQWCWLQPAITSYNQYFSRCEPLGPGPPLAPQQPLWDLRKSWKGRGGITANGKALLLSAHETILRNITVIEIDVLGFYINFI